jgi:hypothetical protein
MLRLAIWLPRRPHSQHVGWAVYEIGIWKGCSTATMRPYFGENTKDKKFPHLLIQLNKALDVQVRTVEQVRAVISQVRHRDL